MPAARTVRILAPVAGINRRMRRQTQPPYTYPTGDNFRALDTEEGRERGGSRPMFERAQPQTLGKAGTISTSIKDNGTTTVTATGSVFEITDVGRQIVIDGTGNAYTISSFTSATIVVVTGDASAETGTFVIGRPIRMLGQVTTALTDNSLSWRDDFNTGDFPGGLPEPNGVIKGNWTANGWADGLFLHGGGRLVLNMAGYNNTSGSSAAVYGGYITSLVGFDSAADYTVTSSRGTHGPEWTSRTFIKVDGTSSTNWYDGGGVMVEITSTSVSGSYVIKSYADDGSTVVIDESGTIDRPTGRVSIFWDQSESKITVTIDGTEILAATSIGSAGQIDGLSSDIAFEVEIPAGTGFLGLSQVSVDYFSTATVDAQHTYVVASSASRVWSTQNATGFVEGTFDTNLDLPDDKRVHTAELNQKLLIADHGLIVAEKTDGAVGSSPGTAFTSATSTFQTDGVTAGNHAVLFTNTGANGRVVEGLHSIASVGSETALTLRYSPYTISNTESETGVSFQIVRSPKYFDPLLNKIFEWQPDGDGEAVERAKGAMPGNCPIIATYNGRPVLGGANHKPHIWGMGKQGDLNDWDYAQADQQRAISATGLATGRISQPLTAWASKDSYAIIGCGDQLWLLSGDPASSGTLDLMVNGTGILSPESWCHGPKGEIVFHSQAGAFVIGPGYPPTFPEPLSRDVLPIELSNIDTDIHAVRYVWNNRYYGVDIYVVNKATDIAQGHYFLEWRNRRFHPMSFSSVQEPASVLSYKPPTIAEAAALVAGKDGRVRRFTNLATDDDGETVTSYVFIGPFAHHEMDRAIDAMRARLDEDSDDVTWSVHVGTTAEEALEASASASGTFSAGLGDYVPVLTGGAAMYIKLTSTGVWAMEELVAKFRKMGVSYA